MPKTFLFDKLVRDKVVTRMKAIGAVVKLKNIASDTQLDYYCRKKIVEEALELSEANSASDKLEELADLLEVIESYIKIVSIDEQELKKIKDHKNKERGGFKEAIIIQDVTLDEENDFIGYFEKDPNKYPEILSKK